MMTLRAKNNIFDHNVTAQLQDEFTLGVNTPIAAYYTTAWFSSNDPALKKQFKRLHMTSAAQDACEVYVDVFLDFNDSLVRRTLIQEITGTSSGMLWDSGLWDNGVWAGDVAAYDFERLPSAGRGNAIKFKFYVVNNNTTWWVDSFALPYKEKAYR
jgi:hypothetical protein